MSAKLDSQAINNFKEYLRIPSVHPNVDYSGCVEFLKKIGSKEGLFVVVEEVAVKKPVVLLSWLGRQPLLPSLLLSSHMDVVPVYAEMWTHEPFGAEEDDVGNIYARGSQDMKCVAIQYLEAVHRLKLSGYQPKRSVHMCFTPDEETGSEGMRRFVESETFKKLNVGCVLDEGVASPDESYNLYYGERTARPFEIVCPGTPGHGSLMHVNTAGEKMSVVIEKFMEMRKYEQKKLEINPNLTLGDVTTINLTKFEGGVQVNVVPPELKVTFDCRVSADTDLETFTKWIEDVCKLAGEGVSFKFLSTEKEVTPTKLNADNSWWTELKAQFDKMGMKINTHIFPAATDARFIRALGIPAFGFSPMNNTPVRLHDHDEFLNTKVFLKGIDIYCNIISALANL